MTADRVKGRLLVVDDDEATRGLLVALLCAHDYVADGVGSGEAALDHLRQAPADLVLLDVNLPGMNGLEVLGRVQEVAPEAEVVMITAFADVDTAVDAMKRGASDYLRKPLRTDELLLVISRAMADVVARRETARLKRHAVEGIRDRMIGHSRVMEELWDRIERVAPTRATVLITGETGSGKELVARAIHELSPRAREGFVATNCSSLPETLLESELFGHVKGSFTGALTARRGLFEEANHGTLFIDEVSTLAAGIQVKLLRVVQERVIQRVGSNTPIPVDLRLLAATNVDLALEVERGAFRDDLFYRLSVFPIRVPSLRERREDIPLLVRYFLGRTAAQTGIVPPVFPDSTLRAMSEYDWPGNVRQLENYVESAVIAHRGGAMEFRPPAAPSHGGTWRITPPAQPVAAGGGAGSLADLERERIVQALAQARGHHARAAALLGIDRRTVERKLKRYLDEGLLDEAVVPGARR